MESNTGGWTTIYAGDFISTKIVKDSGLFYVNDLVHYSSGWLTTTGMEEFSLTDIHTLAMTVDMPAKGDAYFHIDNTVYTVPSWGFLKQQQSPL